jgi:hypothetical protein
MIFSTTTSFFWTFKRTHQTLLSTPTHTHIERYRRVKELGCRLIGSLGWTLFFYLFFFFFFFLALMRPPESSTMRCAHQLTCSISIISHSPTLRAVRSAYHHLLLPVFLLLLYLCVCVWLVFYFVHNVVELFSPSLRGLIMRTYMSCIVCRQISTQFQIIIMKKREKLYIVAISDFNSIYK